MNTKAIQTRRRNLLLGAAASVMFMIGDWLWKAQGPGATAETLGMFIDAAWLDMGMWRFVVSNILAAAAVPLYYIGFMEMYRIIRDHVRDKRDEALAKWFRVGVLAGTISFVFIHTLCLSLPIIFKQAAAYLDVTKAAEIADRVMVLNIVPMIAYFLAADGVLCVVMVMLVWRRTLPVGRAAVLCNPVVTAVLGNVFALLPWPISQLDPASESLGHLLIMVVGLITLHHDEKQMPRLRRKRSVPDDRPIINLDDLPDSDINYL